MLIIFKRIALGLFIAALVTAIRGFRQFKRERAAAAAASERRRVEFLREFEQVRSSSRAPLGAAKAAASGFRVIK